MPRPVLVATAAPVMPSSGSGPRPKMKQGPSMMFSRVRQPQGSHRVAGSPAPRKDRVDQENHEHRQVAAQHDAGIAGAQPHDLIGGAHQTQNIGREPAENQAKEHGQRRAQYHDLAGGLRSEDGILFADAPGHDRRSGKGNADGDSVDQRHDRLRHAHHRNGIETQVRDPEDIHYREQRLHGHHEHHRHRQQQHGAVQGQRGEVSVTALDGKPDVAPERKRGGFGGRADSEREMVTLTQAADSMLSADFGRTHTYNESSGVRRTVFGARKEPELMSPSSEPGEGSTKGRTCAPRWILRPARNDSKDDQGSANGAGCAIFERVPWKDYRWRYR